MELRIFTEPQQGADYGRLLAVARASEQLGFDAFFRSDHYLNMGDGDGLPGPTDAWLTLAGLAGETSRIRLGTLMSPVTFRYPGPLAISVAQVDEMSGGRVELGLGAGWFEAEHTAYGIPFPPTAERFDRLEEQLAIITGLWETPVGQRFSFAGKYYPVSDSAACPSRSARLVRRCSSAGGVRGVPRSSPRGTPTSTTCRSARPSRPGPRSAGSATLPGAGRDPDSLVYSATQRSAAAGTRPSWPAARRRSAGTWPPSAPTGCSAPRTRSWTGSGRRRARRDRTYLQVMALHDLDHLELIAARGHAPGPLTRGPG